MNNASRVFEEAVAEFNARFITNGFIKMFESNKTDNQTLEQHTFVKVLKKLLEHNNECCKSVIDPLDNKKYYRARIINNPIESISLSENKELIGYNLYESKEPPIGMSPNGRNNIRGATYLYLAEDIYTACAEVKPLAYQLISVATFQLKRKLTIIDFSKDYINNDEVNIDKSPIKLGTIIKMIELIFSTPAYKENDYLATQYVSDFIRKYGYDGIMYRSSMSFGNNLTVFNSCEENIEFCGSTVIRCQKEKFDFYDLNSFNNIEPPARLSSLELSNEELSKIKDIIIKNINNGGQN